MNENTNVTLEKVNSLLVVLNATITDKKTDAEIAQRKAELDLAIGELNTEEKANTIADFSASETPVLDACRVGMYALTTAIKDKNGDGYTLGEKYEVIDLLDLSKTKPDAFKDAQWIYYAEALNHAVKDYIMAMQGITKKSKRLDDYKVSATAQILGITVKDMKTSKGMTAALQKVVDSIVDGQTATSTDAEALRLNYSKWGSAINGVSMPIEGSFRKQITRVLFRIVNNEEFIGE